MALQINETTRQNTTKCPYSFQCLVKKRDLCKVSIYIEGDGLFLKKAKYARCPYKQLGNTNSRYRCSCPTRIELYRHYKI
jgi:hypothetical protein